MTCVHSLSPELPCTVWTGFNNGKVLVWDVVSISKIFELECHRTEITQILCVYNENTHSKYVWTCSKDSSICVIELTTFQQERVLTDQKGPIRCMVFLNEFHHVWTCSDTSINIRSTDGKTLKQIPFLFVARNIIFDGFHIWTSSADGKLRVWDCEKQKCIKETKAHTEMVNGLLSTTKQVWSCGDDKVLHIFDSTSLKPIKKIKANSVSVITMVALPGKRVFAFCTDNKVRIWECEGDIQRLNDFSLMTMTTNVVENNHSFKPQPTTGSVTSLPTAFHSEPQKKQEGHTQAEMETKTPEDSSHEQQQQQQPFDLLSSSVSSSIFHCCESKSHRIISKF